MTAQQHVEFVIEQCLETFPPDGDAHVHAFGNMIFDGVIDIKMANILTHIIENPNCVYIVKTDGTLKILE